MNHDLLLDRICDLVPTTLRSDEIRVDSCVLSSKVGMDVARYFGIELKPLPIHVQAWNRPALEYVDEHGLAHAVAHRDEFTATGAWIVSIDPTDYGLPGRYPGHLILREKETGAVLDLSIGQMSRPDKDIVVPKAAWFKDFDPESLNTFAFDGSNGYRGTLVYSPLDKPAKDFRQGADWKCWNPYAGQIIRRLKAEAE